MSDENDKRVRGSAIPRAYEPSGGNATMIRTEADMNSVLVGAHVWDTAAGAWVKMVQPTIETGDIFVAVDDIEDKLDTVISELQDNGLVSTNNSSLTELGGAGIFTGTSDEVLDYATVSVIVYSNVASAANGLSLQFTPDPNEGWVVANTYTVAAATPQIIVFPVLGRYFRLVYTNGASAQTTFILATTFKKSTIERAVERIDDTILDSDLAGVTKAVIAGKQPDGTYANVPLTSNGNLVVSDRGTYWKDIRMEYTDSVLDYRGMNATLNAATSATDWMIEKYTWSGSDCTRIQRQITSWDNRATGWS